MPTDTKIDKLIINYLTEDQYKALTDIDENQLYFTIDESDVYQPLEVTFTEDSDKNIRATLTDEQYNQILSAINSKKEIIAYGNYTVNKQVLKLPLTNPLKTVDNGTMLVYSGVCGYVNMVLGSVNMNWVLTHNLTGDNSHLLSLMEANEFSKQFGIYINSSVANEMTFADGADYYDWNQSQGNKIKFDSINGKPILHTSADINSYYAPTTINTTETPKILQSKNSAMEWVDMPSTNTSLPLVRLTITIEQYQKFLSSEGNAQITFTKEQKEQLLANLPCMFWLAWPDTDGVKSECLLSGFIAFSPFPIRGDETVNDYTVLFFIEGDTYVGTNSRTDTGTHNSHSTIDSLDLPIYFASYLQDDLGANQEGIIFSYRTGEDLLIKFPKINNTQIADNANNYYAPTELNATSTPQVLQCVSSKMTWEDVKIYYSHDLTLEFNGALLSLGFTSTSNTKITTIEALKTALTGRTQVSINGAFKVGEVLNIASKYNPTTNKITVFNGTASVEIALETAGDYTLGAITDEVVEIQ